MDFQTCGSTATDFGYSCCFSHSIKLYVASRCECHCLAALPTKMSVFSSHMQGPIQ